MCLQGVGADLFRDCVLFVERSSELLIHASLSLYDGGVVKARINSPTTQCMSVDPKPGDLTMSRLKRG